MRCLREMEVEIPGRHSEGRVWSSEQREGQGQRYGLQVANLEMRVSTLGVVGLTEGMSAKWQKNEIGMPGTWRAGGGLRSGWAREARRGRLWKRSPWLEQVGCGVALRGALPTPLPP